MTISTYYRLRAMTVDGNGRAAFTHIDLPLMPDTTVRQSLGGVQTNETPCNLDEMRRASHAGTCPT